MYPGKTIRCWDSVLGTETLVKNNRRHKSCCAGELTIDSCAKTDQKILLWVHLQFPLLSDQQSRFACLDHPSCHPALRSGIPEQPARRRHEENRRHTLGQ